ADRERVDRIVHEIAERLIHHAVPRDNRLSGKARRDDGEAPVGAAALPVACMAAMRFAFVDQLELQRLQRGAALFGLCGHVHCSSCKYFASTSDCATTNAIIRPMPPKSLKLTHRSVE